eukprot:gene4342-4920_t
MKPAVSLRENSKSIVSLVSFQLCSKVLTEKLAKGEIGKEVSIVIDGMSISKQKIWSNREQKYMGFVDYGCNVSIEDKEELASEALIFMAVGNTGVTWKSIIGYFVCNKAPSGVLAQLTRTALNFVADAGFDVLSIIWDGTYVNQEAARCLGCRFGCSYESLATAFPHPSRGYLVHVIFDICHMLKLLRNTLADWKEIKIGDKIQEGRVLRQLFCSSKAQFINSRTPRANGYKAPLRKSSLCRQEKALISTANLLLHAKSPAAIKGMLFHNAIKASSNANCLQFEKVAQSPIFTLKWSKRQSPQREIATPENEDLNNIPQEVKQSNNSEFTENVLYYISGYVCRKIGSLIACPKCVLALLKTTSKAHEDHSYSMMDPGCKLTIRKDNGGLLFASSGIFTIVKTCEKFFSMHVLNSAKRITSEEGLCKKLILLCVYELAWKLDKIFPHLEKQCLEPNEHGTLDSHAMQIVKKIAKDSLKKVGNAVSKNEFVDHPTTTTTTLSMKKIGNAVSKNEFVDYPPAITTTPYGSLMTSHEEGKKRSFQKCIP